MTEISYQKCIEISWLLRNFHYDKLSHEDAKKLEQALNIVWDITTDDKYYAG